MSEVQTIFNRTVQLLFSHISITQLEIFDSSGYSSRRKPIEDRFRDRMRFFRDKAKHSLKILPEHFRLCTQIYENIAKARTVIDQSEVYGDYDYVFEQELFQKLKEHYNVINCEPSITPEIADKIREFFALSLEDSYYIATLSSKIKKRSNLLRQIVESTHKAKTENLIKCTLPNGKCFIDFSNIKPWDKRHGHPFNILYFDLIFYDQYWAGHNYSYSYKTYNEWGLLHKDDSMTPERYDSMHNLWYKLVNRQLDNANNIARAIHSISDHDFINYSLEITLASILGYISDMTNEKKIDECLSYIPNTVLPDKTGFKSFLKSIESLEDIDKLGAIYRACVDKSILKKYKKLTRDFEHAVLHNCTFNEAKQKVNCLKILCDKFYDLDSKIIYDFIVRAFNIISEEKFEFLKRYELSLFVFCTARNVDYTDPMHGLSFFNEVDSLIYSISKNVKSKSEAIDYALFLIKSFTINNFQDGIDVTEYAIYKLSKCDDEHYENIIKFGAYREFRDRCREVIIETVSQNRKFSRADAIKLVKDRLAKIDEKDKETIDIYKGVVDEFENLSDELYDELKRVIC